MLGEITDSLVDELGVGEGENQTAPEPESDDDGAGSVAGAVGCDCEDWVDCGLVEFDEEKFRLLLDAVEFCPEVCPPPLAEVWLFGWEEPEPVWLAEDEPCVELVLAWEVPLE